MRRLIAFGDSWTAGHGIEINPKYAEIGCPDDFTHIWRLSNSWPRWLADNLGIQFVNLGWCGMSNPQILWRIEHESQYLLHDDLVIVMWSFPYRPPNVDSVKFLDPVTVLHRANDLLRHHEYYFVNAFFPYFHEEPHNKNAVDISKFLMVDGSAADYLREYERIHNVSIWQYGQRSEKLDNTKSLQGMYHPNLLGYRLIARWLSSLLQGQTPPMTAIGTK